MDSLKPENEEIEPFPYIQTNTGFSEFFHTIFRTGRFPRFDEYKDRELPSYYERISYIEDFGYYLPCMEVVDYIKKMDTKWVSVGCGRGYFERILQLHGVDVIATDKVAVVDNVYFRGGLNRRTGYTDIELISASDAIKKYSDRNVIFSWVSYAEPWGYEALKKIKRGLYVINIGEMYGGCTGDDDFNIFLDNNCQTLDRLPHRPFYGIHDSVHLYKVIKHDREKL